jgi:hypothetical protein
MANGALFLLRFFPLALISVSSPSFAISVLNEGQQRLFLKVCLFHWVTHKKTTLRGF